MYNNIFEHTQDMCFLHYNIIQWDSEESLLTYEVRLPSSNLDMSNVANRRTYVLANNVDPNETAHYDPSHLDLHCLH